MAKNLLKKSGKVTYTETINGKEKRTTKTYNLYTDDETLIKQALDEVVNLSSNKNAFYSYREDYEII